MVNYKLNKLNEDQESDFLSTHFFGCPDVPVKWNEESLFFNDELFLGQINLKETPLKLDSMLYFFVQVESRPYRGIVRVASLNEEFERIDFNSEINEELICDYEVSFDGNDVEFISNSKPANYNMNNNEQVLLKISKQFLQINELKDLEEDLFFIINKKDLENNNFAKAYLSLKLDD